MEKYLGLRYFSLSLSLSLSPFLSRIIISSFLLPYMDRGVVLNCFDGILIFSRCSNVIVTETSLRLASSLRWKNVGN